MRVLLTNIHSLANLGDAALLQRSLQLLAAAFPDAAVTLVADFPETVRARYPHAALLSSPWHWAYQPHARSAVQRHLLLFALLLSALLARLRLPVRLLPLRAPAQQFFAALRAADLVVTVAGGSLIAATPQSQPAGYFTFVSAPAWLALLLGRPLVMLPASYGPFASRFSRLLAGIVMRGARLLCARTASTAWTFADVSRAQHCADLAVALPVTARDQARAAALLSAAGLPADARPVALAAHDWRSQHGAFHGQAAFEALMRSLLDDLTSRGLYVLLVPQSSGPLLLADDRHVLRRIALSARFPTRVLLLESPADPGLAQAIYARAAVVLTSRLHAAIFAANVGTPLLAFSYQRKAADVLTPFGLADSLIPLETATLPLLRDRLLRLYGATLPALVPAYLRDAREQWQSLTILLRRVVGMRDGGAA